VDIIRYVKYNNDQKTLCDTGKCQNLAAYFATIPDVDIMPVLCEDCAKRVKSYSHLLIYCYLKVVKEANGVASTKTMEKMTYLETLIAQSHLKRAVIFFDPGSEAELEKGMDGDRDKAFDKAVDKVVDFEAYRKARRQVWRDEIF